MPRRFTTLSILLAAAAACAACGTIPGRMNSAREVRDYHAKTVRELNVRGVWVNGENADEAFDGAVRSLKESIDGVHTGGDLHWGVAFGPLFSGGTIVPLPIPYWYRPGKGGYVQAFPVANYAEHYLLAGGGVLEVYVARVVMDRNQAVGINEYKGWFFGGAGNCTVDTRWVGDGEAVDGILKTWTYRIGPLPIYRKGEYLSLGGSITPGGYPDEQPWVPDAGNVTNNQPPPAQPAQPTRPARRPVRRPVDQPASGPGSNVQPQPAQPQPPAQGTQLCRYCNSEVPAQLRICPICGSHLK